MKRNVEVIKDHEDLLKEIDKEMRKIMKYLESNRDLVNANLLRSVIDDALEELTQISHKLY